MGVKGAVSAIIMLSLFGSSALFCASALERLGKLDSVGVFLGANLSSPSYELNSDRLLVPASTQKILTALLSLEHWGEDYRFTTEFYLEQDVLWVLGSGDPYLTSEELRLMAKALAAHLPRVPITLNLDLSLFPIDLGISGQGRSNNSYDAVAGALAANFNTVALQREKGLLQSGEAQTPFTSIAQSMGARLTSANDRLSIHSSAEGAHHFGGILSAFLQEEGILMRGEVRFVDLDPKATLIHQHKNSRTLGEVLKGMLDYSNNFIANQLFLLLGLKDGGATVNLAISRRVFEASIQKYTQSDAFRAYEGAGLSRKNRLSAKQIVEVLGYFEGWKGLLKNRDNVLLYKTGTLQGVRTLAGYMRRQPGSVWEPFAILINSDAPHELRFQVAEELRRKLPKNQ